MAILFFCVACDNKAEKSYISLKEKILQVDIDNSNHAILEGIIKEIDNHLVEFPNYEENSFLKDFKKKSLLFIENANYQKIIKEIDGIENITFTDYKEALSIFEKAKKILLSSIENSSIENNIQDAKMRISQIDSLLKSIALEESEFYDVINSNDISEIQQFLHKYPKSVMRNNLNQKMDVILMTEFMSVINLNPTSIINLNEEITKCREYSQKFNIPESTMKITEYINQLESQRRYILEVELENKMEVLVREMEIEAIRKATKERQGNLFQQWNIEHCIPIENNIEQVGHNSRMLFRRYEVKIKGSATGGLFGYDRRKLLIFVTGRIAGDLQKGVSITVTGSSIEENREIY